MSGIAATIHIRSLQLHPRLIRFSLLEGLWLDQDQHGPGENSALAQGRGTR
jgi:hypothetical protein